MESVLFCIIHLFKHFTYLNTPWSCLDRWLYVLNNAQPPGPCNRMLSGWVDLEVRLLMWTFPSSLPPHTHQLLHFLSLPTHTSTVMFPLSLPTHINSYASSPSSPVCVCDVVSMSFSPWQPNHFLVGCSDGTLHLYHTKSGWWTPPLN